MSLRLLYTYSLPRAFFSFSCNFLSYGCLFAPRRLNLLGSELAYFFSALFCFLRYHNYLLFIFWATAVKNSVKGFSAIFCSMCGAAARASSNETSLSSAVLSCIFTKLTYRSTTSVSNRWPAGRILLSSFLGVRKEGARDCLRHPLCPSKSF